MDVDLLARRMPADPTVIEKIVREIAGTSTGNDYIVFEINGIEPIAEFREYNGVRVKLVGRIKNTRTPFHIDMGIGDVIVPKPLRRAIPTQRYSVPGTQLAGAMLPRPPIREAGRQVSRVPAGSLGEGP